MKIKKSDFTHYARFRGVPCYWNNDTYTLSGRNRFFDFALEKMAMPLDSLVQSICITISPDYNPGFAIWLTGPIERKDDD